MSRMGCRYGIRSRTCSCKTEDFYILRALAIETIIHILSARNTRTSRTCAHLRDLVIPPSLCAASNTVKPEANNKPHFSHSVVLFPFRNCSSAALYLLYGMRSCQPSQTAVLRFIAPCFPSHAGSENHQVAVERVHSIFGDQDWARGLVKANATEEEEASNLGRWRQ